MNNVVEGLQTEMDSTSHVLVERSVFKRSVKWPGLGFLSGNFGGDKFNDGFPNTHITVRRNYFTNSDNLSMTSRWARVPRSLRRGRLGYNDGHGRMAFNVDPGHNQSDF